MENIRARDLMVPISDYPTCSVNETLSSVIKKINNTLIKTDNRTGLARAVLVFDSPTEFVGLVRRREIFDALNPSFLKKESVSHAQKWLDIQVDPNLAELSNATSLRVMKKNLNRLVKDVMLSIKYVIEHDDHLVKVVSTMVEHNTSTIPVSEEGAVVGVIRSTDVLNHLSQEVLR
jgi:predicted transcriptional regulator